MKLFYLALLVLSFATSYSQIEVDAIYFDDDSLYAEDLVDAENYTSNESTMYICPIAPELPGGLDSLSKFIQQKFDSTTISDSVSGIIWIAFTIDTSGYFKNAWVMQGFNPEIDSACLEVIKRLPKWVSAQDTRGNKAPSWGYMMRFRLGRKEDN